MFSGPLYQEPKATNGIKGSRDDGSGTIRPGYGEVPTVMSGSRGSAGIGTRSRVAVRTFSATTVTSIGKGLKAGTGAANTTSSILTDRRKAGLCSSIHVLIDIIVALNAS